MINDIVYVLVGFSPIVVGLLIFFAIAAVAHRHDKRVERERLSRAATN